MRYKCLLRATWVLFGGAHLMLAQNRSTTTTAPPPTWSVGPIEFSGLIDAYYDVNFNHPADQNNQLRNFDLKANQFSLNMAKLSLAHSADPVGFQLDLGFGRAFDTIHSSEPNLAAFRNIEQAYMTWKPARAKGLQLDFGEFVTSAGAEVIETNGNWNYSRSLLFVFAIPYYHFGLRSSMPFGKHFTGGFQVVNGWNNIEDTNSGKTVCFSGNFVSSKVTWNNNYMVGPEKAGTNDGLRHLYDTTVLLTPHPKLNTYLNFDYGVDKHVLGGESRWVGVAGAARFQANNWFALAPRLEWFNDADGFTTGTAQKIKEFTMTGEFKMQEGLFTRLEYRRDWSSQPFFNRGQLLAGHKNQDTVLVGLVAYFGPKR
jgi:hypothetical protein